MDESLTATVWHHFWLSNLNLLKRGCTITARGEGHAGGSWVGYVTSECINKLASEGRAGTKSCGPPCHIIHMCTEERPAGFFPPFTRGLRRSRWGAGIHYQYKMVEWNNCTEKYVYTNTCIYWALKVLCNTGQDSPVHTLVAEAAVQAATCSSGAVTIHAHSHTVGTAIWANLGFMYVAQGQWPDLPHWHQKCFILHCEC